MKKFLILFFFILSFSPLSQAQNMDQRRAQLISVIDEELREVARINQQTQSRNPTLMLRMAELLLEKARLIKEQENTRFLDLPAESRQRVNKNEFFKDSRAFFLQAQKTCEFIIKRFQSFDEKGDVYYIMAYNAKEFQQEDRAQRYFDLAVKNAKPGTTTKIRSEIALAEIYYNKNHYSQAIPLYERALLGNVQKDKWWTKDAYNLAWSYFRVQNYDKAIDMLNVVNRSSADSKFVDMRQSVERDLAYFYTEAGRTKEAIALYKKNDGDIAANLLKVGRNLISQGKFAAAETSLVEALKHPKNESQEIQINIELIALYERFGKEQAHLKAAQTLFTHFKANKLTPEQLNILKYQVSRSAALQQQQVAGKTYERQPKTRNAKAARAVAYFQMMSEIEPASAHQSLFHAGETLFAIGNVNEAIGYYDQAVDGANRAKDQKTFDLSLQGMMMSLGAKGISNANEMKYLEKAFRLQLARNPREKKNSNIYQRLFAIYIEKGELDNAEKTLLTFKNAFPREVGPQEAMVAKIMEHYQKTKNIAELRKWIARLDANEFRVSANYLSQAKLAMLNLEFSDVEKFNTEGEKKAALQGYLKIYRHPSSTSDAKKNAAYNISTLFFELGNVEFTYRWAKQALDLMGPKDVKEFEGTFLAFGGDFFNRRKFPQAAEIYEINFSKLCREKTNNKNLFFKNAVVVNLATGNVDKARAIVDESFKCNIPNNLIIEAQLDILKTLSEEKRWNDYVAYLNEVEKTRELWPELIYHTAKLQTALENVGRVNEAKGLDTKMMNYYNESKRRKLPIPIEGLDVIAEILLRDARREASVIRNMTLTFPEERYNASLQAMFQQLDRVTEASLKVLETGSGEGIVAAYRILVESYDFLVSQVRAFTPPEKTEEYITSFKGAMVQVSEPIAQKSREFRSEAVRQIKTSNILASNNSFFMRDTGVPIDIEFYPIRGAVIMDRGGKR